MHSNSERQVLLTLLDVAYLPGIFSDKLQTVDFGLVDDDPVLRICPSIEKDKIVFQMVCKLATFYDDLHGDM